MSELASPEGVIMVSLAVMLDILGILCLILWLAAGIGGILSYIPDIIGIFFIGGWAASRASAKKEVIQKRKAIKAAAKTALKETEKAAAKAAEEAAKAAAKATAEEGGKVAAKTAAKAAKKAKWLKFFAATLGELIPLFGALPFWTMFVVSELRKE